MKNYNPLNNLSSNIKNYVKSNSEKIWKVTKYGVIFPTALVVGLSFVPKTQNAINKVIPTANTNISEVDAAETKPNVLEYFHKTLESRNEKIAENEILRERKNLEDYLSKNLPRNFDVVDLEGYKQIRKNYDFSKVSKESLDDKLLEGLNLDSDMKLSYDILNVKGQKVWAYNVIDSDDINDGEISVSKYQNGKVRVLFDMINKSSINIASSGLKTCDISAVISDIIKSKDRSYNFYRISDGETTFGFVLAPKKLAVKELLEEYGDYNGALLGSVSVKREKIEPTPDNGDDGDQEPTPEPSLEQELNDDADPQDPVNTGCDPNTGDGSTQTDPVVNPDPDPHIF